MALDTGKQGRLSEFTLKVMEAFHREMPILQEYWQLLEEQYCSWIIPSATTHLTLYATTDGDEITIGFLQGWMRHEHIGWGENLSTEEEIARAI